jgi:TRAP-type transport system periplasmic protein
MRMKRYSIIISLLVVLSLVFGIVACSQPASTPTPAPPSTTAAPTTSKPAVTTTAAPPTTSAPAPTTSNPPVSTPAPTTSAAVISLSMAPINCPAPAPAGSVPPASGTTRTLSELTKYISAKTSGRVKIDAYWAQTLSPVNQIVNSTSTGVADIGALAPAQEPGKVPLSLVGQLPGFGTDFWAQSMAYWDLMNQEPLLSEYAKYNLLPLGLDFISDYNLIATKPIRTLADLKGKRMSCSGFVAETVTALGAVPIAMTPQEQYEGLQKGTIDANSGSYSPIGDFKFYEVAKYITLFPFGGRLQPILINKNSWNKLPPDIQTIFKNMIPDLIQINIDSFWVKDWPTFPLSTQLVKDSGLQIIQPSAEDVATIQKIQAGQATAWAATTDKAGMPGTKVLTDYRALVDKYAKVSTFPYK